MNEDLLQLLRENIALQLRHANYDRTIEVRKFSHMVSTGEGQEDEVTRYRRYEHDTLKKQRIRLYNSLTSYSLSRPRKYWKKIWRIEGIRETITTTNGIAEAAEQVRNDFYNFMPGETIYQWVGRMTEYLGVTDPNAWILFERRDSRNAENQIIKTRVVPYVFSSADAVNFDRQFGVVNWVLFRSSHMEVVVENGMAKNKMLENYYLYAPGYVVQAREVGQTTVAQPGDTLEYINVIPPANKQFPEDSKPFATNSVPSKRQFYIRLIENGTTEVPASCIGAYPDEMTGHDSFVAWFEPAKHLFKDIIKLKSSLDIVLTTHTYPHRWEFVKPCRFETPEGGECAGGYINGIKTTENICPSCHGSGKEANFTTEQEVMQLAMPEEKEQMYELSKLAFTEDVDTTLPKLLQDMIEETDRRIMSCVFDSGLYQKPTDSKAKTATEINSVIDGIADVLQPYCDLYAKIVELAYRCAFQYREIDAQIDYAFPEDKKIETLSDMIADLESMKAAGVDYEAIRAKQNRINEKSFEGNPDAQRRIRARNEWMPFADKAPEVVSMIVAARSPIDNDRVLWENFTSIFREIDEENPAFADMAYKKQKQVLESKVDEFKAKIVVAGSENQNMQPFNVDDTNADEPGATDQPAN